MGSKSKQKAEGIVLDQKLKNLAGDVMLDYGMPLDKSDIVKPITDKPATDESAFEKLTLRNVLTDSLLRGDVTVDARGQVVSMPTEASIKHKRFLLTQKIYNAGKRCLFTSAETSLLKEQVSKHHSTMTSGVVRIILDPAEAQEKD